MRIVIRRTAERFFIGLLTLGVTLCVTGCRQGTDLSAVRAFSKTVGETQASFAEMSDDFRTSCLRTVGWQRAAEPGTMPDAFTSCAEDAEAARQWQAANCVVTSYVAALGALAGGSEDSGDYGLTGFSATFASMTGTKTFDAAQQKAVAGAAAGLIGAYFKAKRREALAPIIVDADGDLDRIIATLADVARTNYIAQLDSERLSVRLFFEPNIARAKPGLETLQAFAYRADEHAEQAAIDNRQGAVGPYLAALENIRATHAELAKAVSSNRLEDAPGIVENYVATYKPQLLALQKAFK